AFARNREFAAARLIALKHSLPLEIVDFKGFPELHRGYAFPSSLVQATDSKNGAERCTLIEDIRSEEMPFALKHSATEDIGNTSSFMVTLGVAAYYLQITGGRQLAVGFTKEQMGADSRLIAALPAFSSFINALNPRPGDFEILTPLADYDKAEVVRVGAKIGAQIQISWSCIYGEVKHCGRCDPCTDRRAAFAAAGVEDHTFYKRALRKDRASTDATESGTMNET
ncbi:MAG TPA: 7-cyano-7-deazaguanine synthase, partial [Tepidisphaeraceae bacterium]